MCPADPHPRAHRDESEEASEDEPLTEDAFDLEALRQRGDVPGLLALAKAHRAGTAPSGRDLKKCLEAYRAAAELGSGDAEYAVALFHINGGAVVAQETGGDRYARAGGAHRRMTLMSLARSRPRLAPRPAPRVTKRLERLRLLFVLVLGQTL